MRLDCKCHISRQRIALTWLLFKPRVACRHFNQQICAVANKTSKPLQNTEGGESAIRLQYERFGVADYYSGFGAEYRNPHEKIVREVLRESITRWQPDLSSVLDLACGSGEVTMLLRELGCQQIDAVDPYTGEAYLARTGQKADTVSFEDIASGALAGRHYGLVVCSFAMHLIDESWLPSLLTQLGLITDCLMIITPHKRPEIRVDWGWLLKDELIIERVRARLYCLQIG